jgi:AraC-like DNA-binding protein
MRDQAAYETVGFVARERHVVGRHERRCCVVAGADEATEAGTTFESTMTLETRMATASATLAPFVWSYGQSEARERVDGLVLPLPARPKQVLVFTFRDRYHVRTRSSGRSEATSRAIVVGPQTHHRLDLLISGFVDSFTIHFQPAGFNRLFGVKMTELRDQHFDARDVLGDVISPLEQELAESPTFAGRVRIAETFLRGLLGEARPLDLVAIVANDMFAKSRTTAVAEMAVRSVLTARQFERRFLEQVGVAPKLYARIVRFNAALDRKLASATTTWTDVAHEFSYYDQAHLVRDFRAFGGVTPGVLETTLGMVPELHSIFATSTHPYELHATDDVAFVQAAAPVLRNAERSGSGSTHRS